MSTPLSQKFDDYERERSTEYSFLRIRLATRSLKAVLPEEPPFRTQNKLSTLGRDGLMLADPLTCHP